MASPVWRIARKELVEQARDGRVRLTSLLLVALLAVAFLAGRQQQQSIRQEHQAAQQAMRNFWVNQGAKNPHSAAHYGLWVFKPVPPLALFDAGVNAYTGVTTYLEAHRQNDFSRRPAMDQPSVVRMAGWSAAAILQLLVPLLIILLAFPAFAGEREAGTLRQLLALGVPMRTLLAGKALGIAALLTLVLGPATLLGAAALAGSSGQTDSPRVLGLALTYGAYFALVLLVSLIVSARSGTSRRALLVLLSAWAITSLMLPRAMGDLARWLHPTPSAEQFQATLTRDIANGLDGHDPADVRAKAVERRALAHYGVTSLDSLPVNFDAIRMQASEEHANTVFDHHFGSLYDRYRAQNALVQAAGIWAPLLAVRSLSMALAGSDIEQHRHFAAAAEAYRRGLIAWTNAYLRDHTRTGAWDWKAPPSVWRDYPPFDYAVPPVGQMLGPQRRALLVLGGWLIVALLLFLRTPTPRLE
jgi:ABC-2 type transport system permease protein